MTWSLKYKLCWILLIIHFNYEPPKLFHDLHIYHSRNKLKRDIKTGVGVNCKIIFYENN